MKIRWMGKFDGNEESLPHGAHLPGAVQFREMDVKKLGVVMNLVAIPLMILTLAIVCLRGGGMAVISSPGWLLGCVLALVCLIPHEFLHAICFRENAYIYTYLQKGMLFVTGPESMSKGHFIFLCLLPNLVFGFLPFVLFLIFPSWIVLGVLGAFSIPMGVGDYYNVVNALTQMPKGAKTYMHGFHSYWYLPQAEAE